MKTSLLALSLLGLGFQAAFQSAPAAPRPEFAPVPGMEVAARPGPTFAPLPPDTGTNNAALQNALQAASQTNQGAAAPAIITPVTNAAPPAVVPAAAQRLAAPPGLPTVNPTPAIPAPGLPVPAPASPRLTAPAGPGDQLIAITPPPGATNASPEETLPAGVINFPATDLNQVLQIYAELVGRTVLRPTTLPAPTITLKTQTPLTKQEAIQAFDAVLALNGIAVVNVGDKFVKVVPSGQAGQIGEPFSKATADQLPDMGQFVTHVVQLTNAKPSEVVQALTPFASAGSANGILPIDSSQIVVIRDYSENVKRMLEMIKKVDVTIPSEYESDVIPVKYALAADIANALNSLSSGGGGTTVGGAGGAGGGTRSGFGGSRAGSGFGRSGAGGYGGYGGGGYGGYGGYGGGYGGIGQGVTSYGSVSPMATTTAQPGAAGSFTQRLQNIINKASTAGEIQVLGQTKIIADERTNSLLVFATKEDLKTIKKIVSQLDVVLAQVLIEAVIIQITLDDSSTLGVSYLEKQPHPQNGYFRGIGAINNNNILSGSSFNVVGTATNVAGSIPGGFNYLASLGNDLDVSLTAIAANTRARILQRPRIQTSHAVPASIFVGESRPYPTGSYYGGGAFGGYSSIQQLQIGVTLEVTPLINPDGLVVMDIHQRIDSFEGNVTIQNVGDVPITSEKDASAKVAVRDHDTIMLGGLIENQKTSNNSGVPILKDIPLLGYLFRTSTRDDSRQELIVLIRPTVLPTPEVAALTARAIKDKMPEVRRFENEIRDEDARRLRKADKDLNSSQSGSK